MPLNAPDISTSWYKIIRSGPNILIPRTNIPRGMLAPIMPGWNAGLRQGFEICAINNSGRIYLQDGYFSPVPFSGEHVELRRGSILGMVFPAAGGPFALDLGAYRQWDQVGHVRSTVEIVPSLDSDGNKTGNMSVIERRMTGKGMWDDRSAYVYNITSEGMRRVLDEIIDLSWITDVRVSKQGVDVMVEMPNSGPVPVHLEGDLFRDNFGRALLDNRRARVFSEADIFQSQYYTPSTERYRPTIDFYEDGDHGLKLIVNRVNTYEIPEPAELEDLGYYQIFPSTAASAVRVDDGRWLPLTVTRPVERPDLVELDGVSKVRAGNIDGVIGPQTREGNRGELSGQYVRDPYFYGLQDVFASFPLQYSWGTSFGINRAKALADKFMAVQSGRTHCMRVEDIFDPLVADIMTTNNPYYIKLSNFGAALWGPGVSEDTQMDKWMRILGPGMHVVKTQVGIMTAEKIWGRYNTQNTQRYNRSEQLFTFPFDLVRGDIAQGFMSSLPFVGDSALPSGYFNSGAKAEIAAGATWYKVPFAKGLEYMAVPGFLGTMGHVLFYPVDLPMFTTAWAARTLFSSLNYGMQMTTLGFGFKEGFFRNPMHELSFFGGYWQDAWKQHQDSSQFGTFMSTVGGSGDGIPLYNKLWVGGFGAAAVSSLGLAGYALATGGLDQLTPPTGLGLSANIFFGMYSAYIFLSALSFMKTADKKEVGQKDSAAFQNERPQASTDYNAILARVTAAGLGMPCGELFAQRDAIAGILTGLDALDKNRNPHITFKNPYRNIANQILVLYTTIELLIYRNAALALINDINDNDARVAIRRLAEETREPSIVKAAGSLFRDLGLQW